MCINKYKCIYWWRQKPQLKINKKIEEAEAEKEEGK